MEKKYVLIRIGVCCLFFLFQICFAEALAEPKTLSNEEQKQKFNLNAAPFILSNINKTADEKFLEYIKKSDEELKLAWEGTETCRCTPNLPKIVYGFYPFWIEKPEMKLDFSILSRVGYFSIAPDYGGNIKKKDLLHLRDSKFIKTARQYGTDIDIVLSLYDRVPESKDQGKFVLEREQIVQKLVDSVVEVLEQSGADGVTVVVAPETIDEQKQQRLAKFIYSLGTSLKKADDRYKLSILLFFAEKIGRNASVIKELSGVKEKIDFVLFEMSWHGKDERPTCNLYEQRLHKRIRGLMENGIKPEKIIPIVPVYGFKRNKLYAPTKMVYISEIEKLLDDPVQKVEMKDGFIRIKKDEAVTYYDNLTDLDRTFDLIKKNDTGGIAIWALGLEEDQSFLWKMLKKNFSPDDISYVRRFIKDTPVARPCIWICANRDFSHIAIFYIIPAVIVIFNFAAWFFCQARRNCDKWWWMIPVGFIAWILLFYSYIVCVHDGWWNESRDQVGIVLVVTIIGILLVCAYKIYGDRIRQRLP